jgi:DNA invertase Pin-like site-specific DNA recombinase
MKSPGLFSISSAGKNTAGQAKKAIEAMLEYVRDGDTVFVHNMNRLARNLDDLRQLVMQLTSQKIVSLVKNLNLQYEKNNHSLIPLHELH